MTSLQENHHDVPLVFTLMSHNDDSIRNAHVTRVVIPQRILVSNMRYPETFNSVIP